VSAMWEGFRVHSPGGHLGFVEEVRPGSGAGDPSRLVVRAGRVVVLVVPISEIDAIDPARRLLFVSGDVSEHVPDFLLPAA
jgi:AAA+ superfamily predicted ATPase